MSDNIEEKEIVEEQEINEEAVELSNSELENTEHLEAESIETKNSFIKVLGAAVVDTVAALIISVALLYIFESILILTGYYISQKISMLFIIYVAVLIIYSTIANNSKNGKTLGKKLLNL